MADLMRSPTAQWITANSGPNLAIAVAAAIANKEVVSISHSISPLMTITQPYSALVVLNDKP